MSAAVAYYAAVGAAFLLGMMLGSGLTRGSYVRQQRRDCLEIERLRLLAESQAKVLAKIADREHPA